MTNQQFIDNAKSVGYEIRFTGIGMGYITIGNVKLTETKRNSAPIATPL